MPSFCSTIPIWEFSTHKNLYLASVYAAYEQIMEGKAIDNFSALWESKKFAVKLERKLPAMFMSGCPHT